MPSEAYSLERAGVFARHTAEIIARKVAEADAVVKEKADRAARAKAKVFACRQQQRMLDLERQARLLREGQAPSRGMQARREAFKREMEPYLKYKIIIL